MEKVISLLLIFAPFFTMTQNDQNQIGGKGTSQFMGLRYKMKRGQKVYYTDQTHLKSVELWSDLKFSIVDEIDDTIFIQFKTIYSDPNRMKYEQINPKLLNEEKKQELITYYEPRKKNIFSKNQNDTLMGLIRKDYENFVNKENCNNQFYLLKKAKHSYSFKYKAFTTGTLILPIKIRFKVDSFPTQASPDVSVGPFFGYQFGKKDYYSQKENTRTHTWALFAAPGLIAINSSNSTDSLNKNSTNFGISCGGGYLYELNKFQMGFFVGYDFVFGDPAKTWIYQPFRNSNAPWISVAIGFNFRKE